MRQIGHWTQNVLLVCLAGIVIMNGILLVKHLVLGEELPSLFGCSVVTVLSGSMEPVFSPGDMLIIRKEPSYQAGDVITFKEDNSFITHRLIEKDRGEYVTKGDFNNAPDEKKVRYSAVYGRVWLVIPKLGRVVIFCRSALGVFILIVVFLLLMEVPNGSFFRKEKQKK